MQNDQKYYEISVRNLIVKAIQELQYEEIVEIKQEGSQFSFAVNNNLTYVFKGKLGVWSNIQIVPESLKVLSGEDEFELDIATFCKHIASLVEMSDETLAYYIEEGHQTLFSDVQILKNLNEKNFLDNLSFKQIDQSLPGHTKLIMNKGRIGWGESDLKKYAPEFGQDFKLHFLAIKRDLLILGVDESLDMKLMYSNFLDSEDLKIINEKVNLSQFELIPVHPWQWNKYLKIQYYKYLIQGDIIDLGVMGESFSPQSSLRTLSTVKDTSFDVKVSLSILNTSCVRGIPHKYIESGQKISTFMAKIVEKDTFLDNVRVLKEQAAFAMAHEDFQNIPKASYRFKELLGVVFRESVNGILGEAEKAIPTAGLLLKSEKNSLISTLIQTAKVNTSEWLSLYFQNVVIPLYHLQVKHGVGLVSHGQNTIMILEGALPSGIIIKDFHGDLRLSESSPYLKEMGGILEVLPEKYLIHDLFTGHFITVLRYLSQLLEEESLIAEDDFYRLLGKEVKRYHDELGDSVSHDVNLLKPEFEKVLVNKVRFKMGYSETEERLRPLLGKNLKNPLVGGIHDE